MSSVFLNNKGQYLVVAEHSTRALPVHDYVWTPKLNNATIFNFDTTIQFASRMHFNKWRSGNPTAEIVGMARVSVVRHVTISEMRGV
jgi:hypothetical protein